MSIYSYKCPTDNNKRRVLNPSKEVFCEKCGGKMVKEIGDPALIVKETVDNGFMARKVEQFADSPELLKERNENINKKYKI